MNPFEAFAFSAATMRLPTKKIDTNQSRGASSCDQKRKLPISSLQHSTDKRKRKIASSDPSIMMKWWEDLKSLTTAYPFGVMVTGILGSQCRDIVTIGVMKELAKLVDNDITPHSVAALPMERVEEVTKCLNHCNKKAKLLKRLADTFCHEPIPSTSGGLLKVHGIGPAISEVILCVAFKKQNRMCRESEFLDHLVMGAEKRQTPLFGEELRRLNGDSDSQEEGDGEAEKALCDRDGSGMGDAGVGGNTCSSECLPAILSASDSRPSSPGALIDLTGDDDEDDFLISS